jgi:hypothetical protein
MPWRPRFIPALGNAALGAAAGAGAGLLGGYVYDLQRRANGQP